MIRAYSKWKRGDGEGERTDDDPPILSITCLSCYRLIKLAATSFDIVAVPGILISWVIAREHWRMVSRIVHFTRELQVQITLIVCGSVKQIS